MSHHEHHRNTGSHDHSHVFDSPEMATYAELEGEVLAGFATEATAVLAELCEKYGMAVRRVLDLGSGPGVGTCALAERFGQATVVAVDSSEAMLARAAARARERGFAHRVETRYIDMTDGLGALGRCDAVWASMSLHHVGDELTALGGMRELLGPDGLLVIIERAGPLRISFADDDPGVAETWDRLDAAWSDWFDDMRAGLPGATTSDGYPAMLAAAKFELLVERKLELVIDTSQDSEVRRFAHHHLERTLTQLSGYADAADLAVLADGNAGPDSSREIRATRHLYIARPTS
jgi:SAM-dependent methyltransferase